LLASEEGVSLELLALAPLLFWLLWLL